MSRFAYRGTTRNQEGAVVFSATISVYLAGTTTPASIYTSSSGGTAVNSITSSSTDGTFVFYVDSADYDSYQHFDITASKSESSVAAYIPVTHYDVAIFPESTVFVDVKTITADYHPRFNPNIRYILVVDTSGKNLNIDPVVSAGINYELMLVNVGSGTAIFDSTGLAYGVGSGDNRNFVYDGSGWK